MAISFKDLAEHEIRLPAAWEHGAAFDLLQCQAGRAYILSQIGIDSEPERIIRLSEQSQDYCAYELFEDGSIWYVNNAEDEVWDDLRDFVTDQLIPHLYHLRWANVSEGDRELLTHYFDGDESKARWAVGG